MKLIITGTPNEIAGLVAEIQSRQTVAELATSINAENFKRLAAKRSPTDDTGADTQG